MAAPNAATFRRIDSIAQVEIWCGWRVGRCSFGEHVRGCVSPGARGWPTAGAASSSGERCPRVGSGSVRDVACWPKQSAMVSAGALARAHWDAMSARA
eukprot:4220329-Pleurochrysis_carterae.AAC.3